MLFDYTEIDTNKHPWVLNIKSRTDVSSVEDIALDAVMHDLNVGYQEDIDGSATNTFEDDARLTYWSENRLYTEGEIFRAIIDRNWYVLDSLYVTKIGKIVVDVIEVDDVWKDNNELINELEHASHRYFCVEY